MAGRKQNVIVTVADSAIDNIGTVESELAAKGLKVSRVMPMTGVIAGSCPADSLAKLQSVPGVLSVEEELAVQLPPPDSDVQ